MLGVSRRAGRRACIRACIRACMWSSALPHPRTRVMHDRGSSLQSCGDVHDVIQHPAWAAGHRHTPWQVEHSMAFPDVLTEYAHPTNRVQHPSVCVAASPAARAEMKAVRCGAGRLCFCLGRFCPHALVARSARTPALLLHLALAYTATTTGTPSAHPLDCPVYHAAGSWLNAQQACMRTCCLRHLVRLPSPSAGSTPPSGIPATRLLPLPRLPSPTPTASSLPRSQATHLASVRH